MELQDGVDRTERFSLAMMGKRSAMEGRVTMIVAPTGDEAAVWVERLGLRGIRRADSPVVSSGVRPCVPSQVLMSWSRVVGDWEMALGPSLLSRMTRDLDRFIRSSCSLMTAEAKLGMPFASMSR